MTLCFLLLLDVIEPPYNWEASLALSSLDADRGRNNCEASDGLFLAGGGVRRLSVDTMSSNAERTCSSNSCASGVARRIVSARRLTKRSRSADRVDDGSLHSSGAGTGAGQEARRGRGGAGGPSMSGAVWGASDARRLGLSCCTAAGCCPFAAPSALLVVGASVSIVHAFLCNHCRCISVCQPWRSPFTHHHFDRRSTRAKGRFTAFHA